jgi:hypothetical protein
MAPPAKQLRCDTNKLATTSEFNRSAVLYEIITTNHTRSMAEKTHQEIVCIGELSERKKRGTSPEQLN